MSLEKRFAVNGVLKKIISIMTPKRSALIGLSLILAFTIAMPNQTMALWLFDQKPGKKDQSVLKAEDVSTEITQAIVGEETSLDSTNPRDHRDRSRSHEITSKRTAFTSTYVNKDGTKTLEYSSDQQNFKEGSTWKKINNSLQAIGQPAISSNLFQVLTNTAPKADPPSKFTGKAGIINAQMRPLSEGLKIEANGRTIIMKPVGASNAKPEQKDDRTVIYRNAWANVDLEYELRGESVKEVIVVKSTNTRSTFDFTVEGGKVINHPVREGELSIEGMPEDFGFSSLTLDVAGRGVISEKRVTQSPTEKGIRVQLDSEWQKKQKASAFPLRIDPSFGRDANNYVMRKSDGYSCGSGNCYANTGGIDDNGWKFWRTYFHFPFSDMAGKKILNANMHGYYKTGVNGTGDHAAIWMGKGNCTNNFHCYGADVGFTDHVGGDFDINFTDGMQEAVNLGDWGRWWALHGEEGYYKTFKPYYNLRATITFDTPTPMATPVEPADKQVTVSTQPSLRVNPVSDADGDTVNFYHRVSTSLDAETGAVINSGWITSPQWTIPEGILQDGTTYYWHTYTKGATQTNPNWVRSFRVDLRTGKDSTQAYDNVGPIGVDLATGNGTTSTDTHSMNALGGSIGLSLNYNTPTKAKNGLVGEYWNIPSNYSFASGVPSGLPNLVRNDQDVNFNWKLDSPGPGITSDGFYARWKGYFVAPATGAYQFGAFNDDYVKVQVDGQDLATGCYGSTPCYGSFVNLQAGQIVPINIEYQDIGGEAYVGVYVKGAVAEQPLNRDWLRSEVVASNAQYGLTGRYYNYSGNPAFPTDNSDPMRLMMMRNDSKMTFEWGMGGPAAGLQADEFMTRWTGYITVPATGNYTLGAVTDDGVRIKLNNGFLGAQQTVLDSWQNQAATVWGSAVTLTTGQAMPINVEYFERTGNATFKLLIRDTNNVEQEIPVKWLTPSASALPNSWQMGVDVDGDVSYERLRVAGNNVILEDSTRSTHEYTWTGSGFKPPVNEDGQLIRNSNNTYTLTDTDGKTYIFNAEGKLISLTTPTDDRKPANIKYEYAGDPSRLVKIVDGVNADRFATLHYKSVNEEGTCNTPSGFDNAPDGMLCAFKTTDGDVTRLYYKNGQLSRVEKPGSEKIDYGYDNLGRITSTRDSIANDAIAASVRPDDSSVLTEINYDLLGRISSVRAPKPNSSTDAVSHTFEYLPSATQMHIVGTAESHGFSKRVEYDSLLRTIKDVDVSNNATTTEWDPVKDLELSKTDPTGLKSTTIYDEDDRPIENYGQAPAAMFGVDRKPLAQHVNQVPKTSTGYDEGMTGLAVAYMASNASAIQNVLGNGQTMYRGESRWSLDRRFHFVYQGDGNVVLYGPNGAMWASNTGGASTRLVMQGDGNLVLYNNYQPVWATGSTGGNSSAVLYVQNDGNVVVYRSNGTTWATNTGGYQYAGPSNAALTGTPLLHTTNIADDGTISKNFGSSPIPNHSSAWGTTMTGKMRLPTAGNWNFRIHSDGGVRVWIDDILVHEDWHNDVQRLHPMFTYNNVTANSIHRVRIDNFHNTGTNNTFTLHATPPGGSETNNVAQYFNPNYGLKTSETAYDSQQGNVTNLTTYNRPEYGSVDKTTLDPNGLNLQTVSTYETPGVGFHRQTSKTLPGGGTTTYQHYGASDTRDNPCTTDVETILQGGRPKGKIEADPDGSGPQSGRTSETIYNASGEVVASRYNDDNWTCTEYDSRGRVQKTIIPALGNKPGRTITNDYAKDNNPLITTTTDNSGTIRVENDLVGKTVKYIDANGKVTENLYDVYGKLTKRVSPVGIETYEYDSYDRLTVQKLDNITLATTTYDTYGRISTVQYPAGISLSSVTRDTLGRENGTTFMVNGQAYTDVIERHVSGDIKQGTENGISKQYSYDKAGRLTSAMIGNNAFVYEFGTPDASCDTVPGYNSNAAKNGNRTKQIMNGQVTTYCYDMADRLVSSSDNALTNVQYDSRGNTTSLGDSTHLTKFEYDASDRNTSIKSGSKETLFTRDVQDRIISREQKTSGNTTAYAGYGFNGSGDSPDFLQDANGDVTQKYITLPGDVIVTIKSNGVSAGATTYSLPNTHGDVFATVDADGLLKTTHMSGPFGEALQNQESAINTAEGTAWNYLGQYQRLTDTSASSISGGVIQMGARVYIPALGRFLNVDPEEGGVDNSYVYPLDPVNKNDLDGKLLFVPIAIFVGRMIVQHAAKQAIQQGLKQLAVNRIKGKAAERVAFNTAKIRHPLSRVEKQKTIQTPYGRRVVDIKITSRITNKVRAIEVKAGNSRYTKQQMKKDVWIKNNRNIKTTVWRYR